VLTLWNAWSCPYCQRVRIVLREKGLVYTTREVDLANKPPELFSVNAAGAVPLLEDEEGDPIPDSLVIAQYLDERFPDPNLVPNDPRGRARMRLLLERAGGIARALGRIVRGAPEERDAGERAARAAFEALEPFAPESGFFFGRFGLVDAALAPFVAKLPEQVLPAALALPRLAAWRERVLARPSVARETGPRPGEVSARTVRARPARP
jgi:RNA polymerase-associated protein